jgi:hypothetical protein
MNAGFLIALACFATAMTWCMALISAAFVGAGEGVYGPLELTYGPFFHYWVFLWPILITGANVPQSKVRLCAKLATCGYYLWLLLKFREFSGLPSELSRIGFDALSIAWLLMFLLTHCLIWLPSVFLNRPGVSP